MASVLHPPWLVGRTPGGGPEVSTRTHHRDSSGPANEVMSVTEVAAELGVPNQTVLRRLALGTLTGSRLGSVWTIERSTIAGAGR